MVYPGLTTSDPTCLTPFGVGWDSTLPEATLEFGTSGDRSMTAVVGSVGDADLASDLVSESADALARCAQGTGLFLMQGQAVQTQVEPFDAELTGADESVAFRVTGDVTGSSSPVRDSTYYARLTETTSRSSALNQGVQTRSAKTAAKGASVTSAETRDALARLRNRLAVEGDDRRVAVARRPGEELLLDEYLATRLVELSVHIEDLSLSVASSAEAPLAAVTRAVDVLVAAARERHGDRAVLHALSRRERDERSAHRVL